MNKFILTLQNLRYMIMKKSGIFFAALLSMSVCICGILFYAGYLFRVFYDEKNGSYVKICLKNDDVIETFSILDELEKNYGDIEYIHAFDKTQKSIVGDYNVNYKKMLLVGDMYSMDEEDVAFIVEDYKFQAESDLSVPLGQHIKVGDIYFAITGVVAFNDFGCYIVPVRYFVKNYNVSYLEIGYMNVIERGKLKEINRYLKKCDNVESFSVVKAKSIIRDTYFISRFFWVILIFLAVLLNTFGLLYYWMMYFKRNYVIFRVCGSSVSTNVSILSCQSAVFLIMGMITGNAEYAFLLNILEKYDIVYAKSYLPYIKVSSLLLIILMIFVIVLSILTGKKQEIYRTME